MIVYVRKMHMQMIERRVIVQIASQLVALETVLFLDGIKALLANVLQQANVSRVQVSEAQHILLMNYGKQIQILGIFLVPFHVGQQNEAVGRTRVFKYDSFRLGFVLEYIIDPLEK